MSITRSFIQACGAGIELVAGYAELDSRERATEAAGELAGLHEVYFGSTTFTRKQREAVDGARRHGHSLALLRRIEKYVGKVHKLGDAWALRRQLCTTPGHRVDAVAARRLAELVPRKIREERVRLTRHKDQMWTLTLTGASNRIQDIFTTVDKKLPVASFERNFFRGAGARPEVSTMVVMMLDELDQIVDGDGEEVTLRMTNGAVMTGREVLAERMARRGYFMLYHPSKGPVNLYETSRFANEKQRRMLSAENPTCGWPDCSHPADESQFHHLVAYKDGGPTNVWNMIPLCAYHNGVNEDGVDVPRRRGRMARLAGRVAWIPPGGGEPVFTDSPIKA